MNHLSPHTWKTSSQQTTSSCLNKQLQIVYTNLTDETISFFCLFFFFSFFELSFLSSYKNSNFIKNMKKKVGFLFCQLCVFFVKKNYCWRIFFHVERVLFFIFQADFHYMVEYFLVWTFIIIITTAMTKQQTTSILSTFTKLL